MIINRFIVLRKCCISLYSIVINLLLVFLCLSIADKRHDIRLQFFTEPTSVLVAADGGRAVFKCSASPPSADIRWLYNGMPLYESSSEGVRISRNKLVIRLPKLSDTSNSSRISFAGGVFQCIAQHKNHVIVSQPAKLIVAELKPFPDSSNVTLTAVEGNTAVIHCNPPFSVPNAVTEFLFNGTLISKSKDRYHIMPSGDLQIYNVRESDSGIYRCIVHNPFLGERKNAKHYVHLNVVSRKSRNHHSHNHHHKNHDYIGPTFVVTPKAHVSAIMGSNVTLECAASGNPSPNITWKRLDGHMPKWRHFQDGGNLILPSVRRGDEGTYVCTASNGPSAASMVNANSLLDIQEIPQIVRPPEDRHILEGEEIVLECITKGKPKPIINWLHNGELIKPEDSLKRGIHLKGNDGLKLVINKASQLHSGIYQCFATNELGSVFASSTVIVLNETSNISDDTTKDQTLAEDDDDIDLSNSSDGGPDDDEEDLFDRSSNRRRKNKNKGVKMVPPTRPEITRLSDDSVMVRWDVPQNDGLPILFFKVQYREMGKKGSDWNTVDEDIAPHIHSYAVNSLKAGSKYRFRIAAVYSNNDNKLGPNSIKFTLYKDPPMKKPVYGPAIIYAEPVSPSAITLRWEYLDIDSVAIEGFFIYYRASSTAGDYFKVTVLGANTRSHIISHLLPDTAYDIKMQCFNVAGTSDFSNIYMSKTMPTPDTTKGKGSKKDQIDNNNINSNYGPVRSNDDKTLYCVIAIVIGAVALVFIACIVICILRHKQQWPRSNASNSKRSKMPKEKHPKANTNNHNHIYNHHHSNHNIFSHHRSNGHISNTLVAAASNGYLSRTSALESECTHQINIRVNPFCNDIANVSSLTRANSINETLKSLSSSHHQLSNNISNTDGPILLNTLEKRKMKRMDEHYPNVHLSNPRLNHTNSTSFTRLNGTLERKRKSRTDLLANDVKSNDVKGNESTLSRCNGVQSSTNGTFVIMQSSC